MITVAFKASEPEKAARIVNTVIRIYLQELIRASDAGSSSAGAARALSKSRPERIPCFGGAATNQADGSPAILIAVGAALFGLCVAAAFAILLMRSNDTIRSARQMEYALGMECLGVVRAPGRRRHRGRGCHGAQRLFAPEHQELRRLSATIAGSVAARMCGPSASRPRCLAKVQRRLPSALARAVAASGKRVLLIDGASGKPLRFALGGELVAHSGLVEKVRVQACSIISWRGQAGLHVLPLREPSGGDLHSIGPALLDGILDNIADSYDLVIVDMPALVTGPDVRASAQSLDGFLLVVKWGATESELVRQAFRSAGEARPKFVGAVLNMADDEYDETLRKRACCPN